MNTAQLRLCELVYRRACVQKGLCTEGLVYRRACVQKGLCTEGLTCDTRPQSMMGALISLIAELVLLKFLKVT